MTAVASPSALQTSLARNGWPNGNGQISLNAMTPDEVSKMFIPRKSVQRSNSSSSLSSNSSTSTVTAASAPSSGLPNGDARKKPPRGFWPSAKAVPVSGISNIDQKPVSATASGQSATSAISALQNPQLAPQQHAANAQSQGNAAGRPPQPDSVPMLCLSPMNGTFERKTIEVPTQPDVLKIGRQTNAKTLPTPVNGFFDSKVLSRQHAEIWAERDGKIWIRDVRSSNGTFVNGKRLSPENRDSEPHVLKEQDVLELGIDIVSEDGKTIVHHKVAARIEHAGIYGLGNNGLEIGIPHASGDGSGIHWNGNWRNRQNSTGSISSARSINSYASGAPGAPYGTRLQPVTMEQIVKKLNTELKQARLQSADLKHTSEFVNALVNHDKLPAPPSQGKVTSPSKVSEVKARLGSEPPAPPPSQPLPEKPDPSNPAHRLPDMPTRQPYLRRTDTERPSHLSDSMAGGMGKLDANKQIFSLIEALSKAHKEMASQAERIKLMEEALRVEREARSNAEQLITAEKAPVLKAIADSMVPEQDAEQDATAQDTTQHTEETNPTSGLEERLDHMDTEMINMRQQVLGYRRRAEVAEEESQRDRQTLTEMVASIRRRDEAARKRKETRLARRRATPMEQQSKLHADGTNDENDEDLDDILDDEMHKQLNGRVDAFMAQKGESSTSLERLAHAHGTAAFADMIKNLSKAQLTELGTALDAMQHGRAAPGAVAVRSRTQEQLMQASPYASLVGVVLLGVGMMAYLNGWQRVIER